MQKIIPHLWFDTEANAAAKLYASIFPDSTIINQQILSGTPSGDVETVHFTLCGQEFMAISAGPLFTFNPAISFHVKCQTKDEVDEMWQRLSVGGKILMELGAYPFSQRYGWLQDQYGVSWQLIYTEGDFSQRITPVLMFTNTACGKAEEAVAFYASLFPPGKAQVLARYGQGEEPDQEGTVKYASYTLAGQEFGAMDSARGHTFSFNEAISLIVNCDDQAEIDYYWAKLSAVPAAEQCGWLKDKYGVSWQIVPRAMNEMMSTGTPEQLARVIKAFLSMKKFDVAALRQAYDADGNT